MSFVKVYIHFVWSTKNRKPFLHTRDIRFRVWNHIYENGKEKGIFIETANGFSDHCHCLVSLTKNQTIEKTIQLIKGESSYWINKNEEIKDLIKGKFQWQDDYFATSISYSHLDRVRNYIANQEAHHHKKTFEEEVKELMDRYNFQYFKN